MRRVVLTTAAAALLALLILGGRLIAEPDLDRGAGSVAVSAAISSMSSTDPVRLVHDEVVDEFVILHGPVDIPASKAGVHGAHASHDAVFPRVAEVIVPFDGFVFGFYVDLFDQAGRPLSSDLLHHVNLVDPDRRELFAPISLRVSAAGKETGYKGVPPRLMGIPLRKGQRLVIHTMLHNASEEPVEAAVLRYHLRIVPQDRHDPLLEVFPFWVDVRMPAGDKTFDLPPGRSSVSYEARPEIPGRILALSGHAHRYVQRLIFEDVTSGKTVWETVPELDEEGEVIGVPIERDFLHFGTPIDPSHTYRLTAEYENPTGETIPDGGMGSIGGVFLPEAGVDWPAVDTTEELYQLDLKHYHRELLGKLPDLRRALADSVTVAEEHEPGHSH